jgi:pimeloyl-ACP methyl ester carboxylesterase
LNQDQHERILTNQLGEFHYQVYGPEDAPAIIFSHGVAMDHRTFDNQVQALQEKYRVITWDMPFHGRSDPIGEDEPYSSVCANLLVAIMDDLGITQAIFAGLSLGSFVVQHLSANYPQRVTAEIHISGGPLHPRFPSILKASIPFINLFMKLYPQKSLARTFAKHKALTAETIAYLTETAERTGKAAITHLTVEMVRDMVVGLPAPTNKPALIVYGDHDIPFVINMSKKWHERLPNGEIVRVDNAHHILNQDNPSAFNAAVLNFMERVF